MSLLWPASKRVVQHSARIVEKPQAIAQGYTWSYAGFRDYLQTRKVQSSTLPPAVGDSLTPLVTGMRNLTTLEAAIELVAQRAAGDHCRIYTIYVKRASLSKIYQTELLDFSPHLQSTLNG